MLIMGLNDEYIKAWDWVASRNVVSGSCSSLFETTIRIYFGWYFLFFNVNASK
jgi:hypothetical protein